MDSCGKYGRYYQWTAAMALDPQFNTTVAGASLPRRGICPENWHLPSQPEFNVLRGAYTPSQLKSSSGWAVDDSDYAADDPSYGYGLNLVGFNILAAGITGGGLKGRWAVFWTASEAGVDFPDYALYSSFTNGIGDGPQDQAQEKGTYLYPIRCVKN